MDRIKEYSFTIILALLLLFFYAGIPYTGLIITLNIVLAMMIIDKLGKGIVLRELIAFLYCLTCLLMPLVGYTYYTRANGLATIWVKYMPVSPFIYFDFVFPAVTAFSIALCLPFKGKSSDSGKSFANLILKIREIPNKERYGIILMVAGILSTLIINDLPIGLQFFVNLIFLSSFAGVLYIYYSPEFNFRLITLLGITIFIIAGSLKSGMFTIIAYMGTTLFSFFFFGNKMSFLRKAITFLIACFFIIILQNTKRTYRVYYWVKGTQESPINLFSRLFVENLLEYDNLFEKNAFFPVYVRSNQGFNIALVMRHIPNSKPFDGGDRMSTVMLSSVIPRFLWADKPEAGGKFNMDYYAGKKILGWSTNVGTVGEAYGSFGIGGGIIYIFILGLGIRWAYGRIFSISNRLPLLVCWLPVLFYQITYSAETDTLAVLNSLIKASFFVWLIYKFFPKFIRSRNQLKQAGNVPVFSNI